jgi:hypothetical protein
LPRPHQVSGLVTFENPRTTDAVVAGGRVAICNGVVAEGGGNRTAGAAANGTAPRGGDGDGVVSVIDAGPGSTRVAGCSGPSFSLLLSIKPEFGALIPAGARAAVPFEGVIEIRRATGAHVSGGGMGGPAVSASVDAVLVDGARVVSPEQRIAIDVEAGAFGGTPKNSAQAAAPAAAVAVRKRGESLRTLLAPHPPPPRNPASADATYDFGYTAMA